MIAVSSQARLVFDRRGAYIWGMYVTLAAGPRRCLPASLSPAVRLSLMHKRGMKSANVKRSITIYGHKTSISLEDEFWRGLLEIASYKKMTVPALLGQIYDSRKTINLSSAVRIFVLKDFRRRLANGPNIRPKTVHREQRAAR